MKIKYDPQADALYILFTEQPVEESDEVSKGIIIDYNATEEPVGIEILKASRLFKGKKEVLVELPLPESLEEQTDA
ncbi:MAG TPA: DUF2283 domain-containing protein [Candidatus Lokiarchaeia archaeon]|nr:DUF2283 domain-containing protein [Candidatus Lokiarchaeia archaeon]